MSRSLIEDAKIALSCLDLTELSETCQASDIEALCWKAKGELAQGVSIGQVAAVCVWPAFVAQARQLLPSTIQVAAVVNFPSGQHTIAQVQADIKTIRDAGGSEVDCVLPYQDLMAGADMSVLEFLKQVRQASQGLRLKLILETGALLQTEQIAKACQLALAAGVDFLKTSTGKIPQGASLQAAEIMLDALQQSSRCAELGFKPSGGIKTVQDASAYINVTEKKLGAQALNPQRFRIGASGIWTDIVNVLGASEALKMHLSRQASNSNRATASHPNY